MDGIWQLLRRGARGGASVPRRLVARLASSLCSFPAAQKFFVAKRVLLTLERMSVPLKSAWSLGATYQVSVLARRAEIILTVTTLLGKTKSERHPSLLAAPVPTVYLRILLIIVQQEVMASQRELKNLKWTPACCHPCPR